MQMNGQRARDVFGDKRKVRRRHKMAIALRNFAPAKLGLRR